MADYSNMSDAELLRLVQPNYSQMSDADLLKVLGQPAQEKSKAYSGAILPFSKDEAGKVSFDSNAGLLGTLKRAVTLPGDVVSGKARLPSEMGVPGSVPYDSPEGQQSLGRVLDLAAVGSPIAPRAGPRVGAPVPTTKELFQAANQGYDAARGMQLDIKPSSVKTLAETAGLNLERDGINAELAPKTFSILKRLGDAPEGSVVTVNNLETLRRTLGNAAQDFSNPTEQKAAVQVLKSLQDYMGNVPAGDVLAGDPRRVAQILAGATGNYAAGKRAQGLADTIESAELRAATANSGQNSGNTIRQNARRLLENDSQGYAPAELAQLERVATGSTPGNAARFAGNLLGGGGGLGAVVSAAAGGAAGGLAGGPIGGVVGASLPVVGYGLKQVSDASVMRQARILDEMLRKRSPLGAELTEGAMNAPGAIPASVLARMMLAGQAQQ